MNKWTKLNEQEIECVCERESEWVCERTMNERMREWMCECMSVWIRERMREWENEWMALMWLRVLTSVRTTTTSRGWRKVRGSAALPSQDRETLLTRTSLIVFPRLYFSLSFTIYLLSSFIYIFVQYFVITVLQFVKIYLVVYLMSYSLIQSFVRKKSDKIFHHKRREIKDFWLHF